MTVSRIVTTITIAKDSYNEYNIWMWSAHTNHILKPHPKAAITMSACVQQQVSCHCNVCTYTAEIYVVMI